VILLIFKKPTVILPIFYRDFNTSLCIIIRSVRNQIVAMMVDRPLAHVKTRFRVKVRAGSGLGFSPHKHLHLTHGTISRSQF